MSHLHRTQLPVGVTASHFRRLQGPMAVKQRQDSAQRGTRFDRTMEWADARLGVHTLGRKYLRKVFPDHWSFMLGEIALWSFVVLLITGVFLTFWFRPSAGEVEYQGAYAALRGITMSEAYGSVLHLSFDVRGGLLLRQVHHWAAMLFISSMMIHLARVFFTGAHRKPRELTWAIGAVLLLLGTLEGFTGYSLPDDLLSGTGLRAAYGFVQSIPIVGTYIGFFLFGGEFPGDSIIPRLYTIHVLLIPGLLLGLIAVHLILLVYHKHTHWAGPRANDTNVVGFAFVPVYAAKSGGFFFIVFGITAIIGGLLTINPVWKYGPYDPTKVTAGSQPDWYLGFPDGALRLMPGWESHFWGHTWSWNVFLPVIIFPIALWATVLLLPFVESWITGDQRVHHVLQRPRNAPARTATLVALMTVYAVTWLAGGNDLIAIKLNMSINNITYALRFAFFAGPVIAYQITKRWCVALQRHDNVVLTHGAETGVISRSAEGGYNEAHRPLAYATAYTRTVRDAGPAGQDDPLNRRGRPSLRNRLRALYYEDDAPRPELGELLIAPEDETGTASNPAITDGRARRSPGSDDHARPE